MVTYEDAKELQQKLNNDELFAGRLEDFARLRKLWQGKYWEIAESDANNVSSVFRDMVQENNVSPELRLVNNLLQQVCVKYQTFLSDVPMIRVFSDYEPDGNTNKSRNDANTKERYLYGLWGQRPTSMNKILNTAAWYLPLFGDCFMGIAPDFKTNTPKPFIRSPENAYPVPNYSDGTLEKIVFRWDMTEEVARASFGDDIVDKGRTGDQRSRFAVGRAKDQGTFELLEYSDKMQFKRWVNGVEVNGIEHKFGFNLFDQIGFIMVPDSPWNHGAVEQLVGMVEMGNALLSLSFQAVLENVFPTMFLINPMKMPEELNLGPGGVVPLNEGGDVKWVSPPTQALQAQLQMLDTNEQSIKQGANMPDVSFGQSDASIITGRAVNELQGAGTGSVIEMVQGTSLGEALVSWNEKAIFMGQQMFKDDEAHLFGLVPDSGIDLNPKQFSLNIKGKELKGSVRNEIVFSPHSNAQQKVVQGLQMAGAGLVSKKWQRDQVGIPDNAAMEEEIISETITDAVLQGVVQAIIEGGQAGDAEGVAEAERQAIGLLQGRTQPETGGTPQVGPPVPGGAPPVPGGAPPVPGGPPGLPPPAGGPQPAGPADVGLPATNGAVPPGEEGLFPDDGSGVIALQDAVAVFQQAEVTGRVWLVGEIVQTGQTTGEIEIDVTEPADRQALVTAAPQFEGRMEFRVISTQPDEPAVEITPGADTEPTGLEQDPFADEEEEPLAAGQLPPGAF